MEPKRYKVLIAESGKKDIFPVGYDTIGFSYRGYEIYIKPYHSYLLFYTVDEYKSEVTVL